SLLSLPELRSTLFLLCAAVLSGPPDLDPASGRSAGRNPYVSAAADDASKLDLASIQPPQSSPAGPPAAGPRPIRSPDSRQPQRHGDADQKNIFRAYFPTSSLEPPAAGYNENNEAG